MNRHVTAASYLDHGLRALLPMSVSQLTVSAQPTAVTHRGSWDVEPAHRAVIDECERLGLERAGPRWEIYGPFNQPGDEEVEIYYLVR